jgi:hypothetical protein
MASGGVSACLYPLLLGALGVLPRGADVGWFAVRFRISIGVLAGEINPVGNIVHNKVQITNLAMILCMFISRK